MSDIVTCVIAKGEMGIIEREEAERFARRHKELSDDIAAETRLPYQEAQRRAAARLQDEIERESHRKRRMHLKQAMVETELTELAEAAENAGRSASGAMMHRLAHDPSGRGLGPSVDTRIAVVRTELHSHMADFMSKYRTRYAGMVRPTADIEDFIRERGGVDTGNPAAKEMAEAFGKGMDRGRGRYNASGGDILQKAGWDMWHNHDSARIVLGGKERWKTFVRERVDPDRMFDGSGQKLTLRQLDRALDEMYDNIASGGVTVAPDSIYGSSVTGRAQRRFLAFKSPDDWLAYHREYGEGDILDHILMNVEAFARDIGVQEVLGPFPEATLATMKRLASESKVRAATATAEAGGKDAVKAMRKVGEVWDDAALTAVFNSVTGRLAVPSNHIAAQVSQANRNVLGSALLGGAWLSSFGDVATTIATARYNGIPVFRVLARQFKMFLPGSDADRRLALRVGLGAEGWSNRALAVERFTGEFVGPEVTQRISDTTHRLFLLSPWTAAGRGGMSFEHLAYISDLTGNAYSELPKEIKNFFGRYQIGPSDWELIRRTPQYADPETGATMLRFEDISTLDDARLTGNKQQRFDAANKLAAGILTEANFALIGVSPRVHALTTGGLPAGSFWGEVARNATLFKQFPISLYHTHWNRIIATKDIRTKAEAAAWLFIGMTGMGAIGLQASQISKGRDPLDMTDPRFWAAAAMKGGSLGLFGDFLFADQNRFGGSLMETLAGPVGSQISDVVKLTVGNAQEALAGEETHFGRELWNFVEDHLPGHTGWYVRLAFERLISDKIEEAIDPDAPARFGRIEDRARRDYDQQFWWRPGRIAPDRGPDMGAAVP